MKKVIFLSLIIFLSFQGYAQCDWSINPVAGNVSCYGGNNGFIEVNLEGDVPGSTINGCTSGPFTPSRDCSTCTDPVTGNNDTVRVGEEKCISAGTTFNGDLTIDGGTLIICGNAQVNNLHFKAGTVIITGSVNFTNFNMNVAGTLLQNYGTVSYSNLAFSGRIENYKTLTTTYDFDINPGGELVNNDSIHVGSNFNNSHIGQNSGRLYVKGVFQNNAEGIFTNNCKINVTGNFINNNQFTNTGQIYSASETKLNRYSLLAAKKGSSLETGSTIIDGSLQGDSTGCSLYKINGNTIVNSNARVTGGINFCGYSGEGAPAGTIAPEVQFTCVCSDVSDPTSEPACAYTWSDGGTGKRRDNLSAGTYIVTVECEGCSNSDTIVITQPLAPFTVSLSAKASATSAAPCNGSVTVLPEGGTSPFYYQWTGTSATGALADSLCPGSYSVVATDASGCTASGSATVDLNASACSNDYDIDTDPVSCAGGNNGSIVINVIGAGSDGGDGSGDGGTGTMSCSGVVAPTQDCISCSETASGTYINVEQGEKVCVPAGTVFEGSVDMNGGTLVICGEASVSNINFNSGTILVNGKAYFPNLNANPSQTVNLENFGTVDFTNITFNGIIKNHGRMTVGQDFNINSATATFINTGTLICGQSLNNNNIVENSGVIEGISFDLKNNGDAVFTNSCTINVGREFHNNGTFTNYGKINVQAETKLNGGSIFYSKAGSAYETKDWFIGGTLSGDTACSLFKISNFSNISGSADISGKVYICDANGIETSDVKYSYLIGCACESSTDGGSDTLTALYTYVWPDTISASGNSATGLQAGTYKVIVKNDNCADTLYITVGEGQSDLAVSIDQIAPASSASACNGSATVSASGALGRVSFTWSNGQTGPNATGLCSGNYTVTAVDSSGCSKTVDIFIGTESCDSMQVHLSAVDASCYNRADGTLTPEISNAYKPYSYEWSNGSTDSVLVNIPYGTYTLTFSDARGCSRTVSRSLAFLSNDCQMCDTLSVTADVTQAACPTQCTGSITALVENQHGGINYFWNGVQKGMTVSNVCSGSYLLEVKDDSLCYAKYEAKVGVFSEACPVECDSFKVEIASVNEGNCSGDGRITFKILSGKAPFSYSWNTSDPETTTERTIVENNLVPGSWTVSVTDSNGCYASAAATLNGNGAVPLVVSIAEVKPESCTTGNDGSATAQATGGTGTLSYIWNNSSSATGPVLSNVASGTYRVTVTDQAACSISEEATIPGGKGNMKLTVDASAASAADSCNGTATVNVSGSYPPYTYNWTNNVSSTATATNLCPGFYTVTVTDNGGCSSKANVFIGTGKGCDEKVTVVKKNVSCSGSTDGSIELAIPVSYPVTACYSGSYVPPVDCNDCYAYLEGDQNLTIDAGRKYCVKAGKTITGNVNVNNGSLVACGDLSNINLTIGEFGKVYALGSSTYSNLYMPHVNSAIFNYGLLTINGFYSSGKVENYGKIYFPGYAYVSTDAKVLNRGEINAVAELVLDGQVTNEAIIKVGTSFSLNSGRTFINRCTFTAASYTISGAVTNSGSMKVSGSGTVYSDGSVKMSAGSLLKAGSMSISGDFVGEGTIRSLVQSGTAAQLNNTASFTGQLALCNIPNHTATFGADVIFDCTISGESPCPVTWSNGMSGTKIENLAPGVYSYQADCGSCSFADSVVIAEPTPLSVKVIRNISSSCANPCDGEILVDGAGGTGNYTFNWSGGKTGAHLFPLCPGPQFLELKDKNGCQVAQIIEVGTGICNPVDSSKCKDFSVQISGTDASCGQKADGSAVATISGGQGKYTYFWNTQDTTESITFLRTGTYTVRVVDRNLCEATDDIIIGAVVATCPEECPTQVIASIEVVKAASCENICDADVEAVVSGGTAPYFYRWNNVLTFSSDSILTKQCIGTYTLEVKDSKGCISEVASELVSPVSSDCPEDDLLLTVTGNGNATCSDAPDGYIQVHVSGGTTPYVISWDNGRIEGSATISVPDYTISDLTPGFYEITVRDNKNYVSYEDELIEGYRDICKECDFEIVPAVTQTTASCLCDGSLSVTINDSDAVGATYTYLWSNGSIRSSISKQCAGDYWVEVTKTYADGRTCKYRKNISLSSANTATVTCPPDPGCIENTLSLTATVLSQPTCPLTPDGEIDLVVEGGNGGYTYLWSTGSITEDLAFQAAGDLWVEVTDAENCMKRLEVSLDTLGCDTTSLPEVDDYSWVITPASCSTSADGSIDVTIVKLGSGGDYNYKWTETDGVTQDIHDQLPGSYTLTVTDNSGQTFTFSLVIPVRGTVCPPPGDLAGYLRQVKEPSCQGASDGSIDLVITDGTGPFTYSWSNGSDKEDLSGETAGIYTVTVTDALNQTISLTDSIKQGSGGVCPDSCIVTADIVNTGCPEDGATGSITVKVTNGIGPFTYSWTHSSEEEPAVTKIITDLEAGSYTVNVKGAGTCNVTKTFNVGTDHEECDETLCPEVYEIHIDPADCGLAGTRLYVTPAAISYRWSTGEVTDEIIINQPGYYSVDLITPAGCEKDADYTVAEETPLPSASITPSQLHICPGGSAVLTASGGGASYTWFPGGQTGSSLTVTQAGTYSVQVTYPNGCSSLSEAVTIDAAPDQNDVRIIASGNAICPDQLFRITLSSPIGKGNNWFHNGNHISDRRLIEIADTGTYRLEVQWDGCSALHAELYIGLKADCDDSLPATCHLNAFPSIILDSSQVQTCKDFYISQARFIANNKYNSYVEEETFRFRNAYIEKCLDVYETFDMRERETQHHYTLYYYDQSGNLVRTVPPAGVNVIRDADSLAQIITDRDNGNKSIYTSHDYLTTYTYNSLNQLVAQNMPDHDPLQKYNLSAASSSAVPGVTWNGGELTSAGTGILFGKDQDGKGVVYYTEDNGNTWNEINGLGIGRINDIRFVTNDLVMATGNDGALIKSIDGGATWNIVPVTGDYDLTRVFFEDELKGHLLTSLGVLLSTTDGGLNWSDAPLTVAVTGALEEIYFKNYNEGFVLTRDGNQGRIFKTTNAGINWVEVSDISTHKDFADITVAGGVQFIAGQNGLLLEDEGNLAVRQTGFTENIVQLQAAGSRVILRKSDNTTIEYDPATSTGSVKGSFSYIDGSASLTWAVKADGTAYSVRSQTGIWSQVNYGPANLKGVDFLDGQRLVLWEGQSLTYQDYSSGTTPAIYGGLWGRTEIIDRVHLAESGTAVTAVVLTEDHKLFYESNIKDGTVSWTAVAQADAAVIDWSFSDHQNGVMLTDANVYQTINGGASWTGLNGTLPAGALAVHKEGASIFLITTSQRYEYNSLGWSARPNAVTPGVLKAVTFDEGGLNGYIAGNNGAVFTTTDGGATWKQNYHNYLNDFTRAATDKSAATGGVMTDAAGNILYGSENAWTLIAATTPAQVEDLAYYNSTFTGAAGTAGIVRASTSSTGWTQDDVDNKALYAVDANSAGKGLAAGSEGVIYATSLLSSGTWTAVDAFSTLDLSDAHMVNATTGYAAGKGGVIIKTTDGGKRWQFYSTGVQNDLNGVHFNSTSNGIAVGNGIILYTSDGGDNWTAGIGIPTTDVLNAVYMVSSGKAYAVGNGGKIYSTTNGGANWNTMTSPTASHLYDIHFFDEHVGYAVGASGTILRYTLSDNTWTSLKHESNADWVSYNNGNVTADLRTVYFRDYVSGYVAGDNGIVLKTVTRGESWELYNKDQSGSTVVAVSFADEENAIVVTPTGASTLKDGKDRYSTLFWYDRLGRLVLSQNAKQFNKATKAYSYTTYDSLGRIVEVGELATASDPETALYVAGELQIDDDLLAAFISAGTKTEVTRTQYDTPLRTDIAGFSQTNLRNRVAAVTYSDTWTSGNLAYDHGTHYSYDIHGNVHTLIQDNPSLPAGHRYKRVDYEYDLVSGNVNMVKYQDGALDQFYHKYSYDADNRITEVYTSSDGLIWDKDANYNYYQHGPLARAEIGDLQVQGMDYAYTIQGWIKGVNSNTLVGSRDIGKDGDATAAINAKVPVDAFGYSLNYYSGDYLPVGTGANSFLASTSNISNDLSTTAPDLYNGNIKSMVTAIPEADPASVIYGQAKPQLTAYKYDQLNRIKQLQAYHNINLGTNQWLAGSDGRYKTDFSYDANGNILTLNRHGLDTDSTDLAMDSLIYKYETLSNGYQRNTNRLRWVDDAVDAGAYSDDIDDQSADNYLYDEIGNLVKDVAEEIDSIKWTVYGKVHEVKRTATSTKPDLEFRYDASGNRIAKIVKPAATKTDATTWTITYYLRDASGNVMSTYKEVNDTLQLREQMVYGSDRLGVVNRYLLLTGAVQDDTLRYYRYIGSKQFEGKNHLGNVLVTFSDKKLFDNGRFIADIGSVNDYYAFGSLMPGRTFSSGRYRYGFNGKELDLEGMGGGSSTYDYGFRIYNSQIAKFLSVDPIARNYPYYSPYHYAGNTPIFSIDRDGLEPPVLLNVPEVVTVPRNIFVDTPQGARLLEKVTERVVVQRGLSPWLRIGGTTFLTVGLVLMPHNLNGGEQEWMNWNNDQRLKQYRLDYLKVLEHDGNITAEEIDELERLLQELEGVYFNFSHRVPVYGSSTGRPHWRESEIDVGILLGEGYVAQQAFLEGEEQDYNRKGTAVPDFYNATKGESVEVKNYNVSTSRGIGRLARNISGQFNYRLQHLPEGTTQRIIIDIRGQSLTYKQWDQIVQEITKRVLDPDNIKIEKLGDLTY